MVNSLIDNLLKVFARGTDVPAAASTFMGTPPGDTAWA
jgi:hypothetical protein